MIPNAYCTARQAIVTSYYGPTNHRGARIVAKCEAGRLVVPWDHALDCAPNFERACRALAAKLGWSNRQFVGGCPPSKREAYVFVDVGPYRPPSSSETDG